VRVTPWRRPRVTPARRRNTDGLRRRVVKDRRQRAIRHRLPPGAGTVGVTQILSGGTLAPGGAGSPTGVLSVSGSLAFQSGAIYLVMLRGANSSSTSVTGGAADIANGAVAHVAAGSTPVGGTTYTILTATGGVHGTFANASVFAGAYQYLLSYDADDVYLTAKFNSLVSLLPAMVPTNVRNVANAIDNAISSGAALPPNFQALFNLPPAQLQAALTRLSGETATGAQQTTFDAMTQFMGVMTDPFTAGRGVAVPGATGFADANPYASTDRSRAARDAYAMFTKAPLARVYDPHWSVWASGFGGSQTTDGNAAVGSNTTTSSIGAVAVGADYLISPQTIAGFALSGGGTSFSVANGGSGHSDLFRPAHSCVTAWVRPT
jgi:outer membrane autotransporter protein